MAGITDDDLGDVQLDQHDVMVFQCPVCQHPSLRLDRLAQHARKMHPTQCILLQVLKCSKCGMVTNSQSLMLEHCSIWHNGEVQYRIAVDKLVNATGVPLQAGAALTAAAFTDSEVSSSVASVFHSNPECISMGQADDRPFDLDRSGLFLLPDGDAAAGGGSGGGGLPSRLGLARGCLSQSRVQLARERLLLAPDRPQWPPPPPRPSPASGASAAQRRAAAQAAYADVRLGPGGDAWHPEAAMLKALTEKATGRLFNSVALWRLKDLHAVDWFSWTDDKRCCGQLGPSPAVALLYLGGGERTLRLRRQRGDGQQAANAAGEIRLRPGDLCLTDGGFQEAWQQRLEPGVCGGEDALVATFLCQGGAARRQEPSVCPAAKQPTASDAECQTEVSFLEAAPATLAEKAKPSSMPSEATGVAGLPQINLLQLMYMAHGPVEINLRGSYQLDRTKDGVHACISFMPSFIAKTVGEQFMDTLKQELSWKQLSSTNKVGKERQEPRLTCYVGPDFHWSGNKFENCNEWHPKLLELRELVEKAVGRQFNACLAYMFRHGRDSIGWHCENEKQLGEHPYIAAVTLGQARYLEFTRKGREDRYVRLRGAHGDLVVTEGAMEELWVHRIAKDSMARRTNYTFSFRNISTIAKVVQSD